MTVAKVGTVVTIFRVVTHKILKIQVKLEYSIDTIYFLIFFIIQNSYLVLFSLYLPITNINK